MSETEVESKIQKYESQLVELSSKVDDDENFDERMIIHLAAQELITQLEVDERIFDWQIIKI